MPAGDDVSRLAKLKAAIQTGEYETPEKLEETLRSVLADLRKLQPRNFKVPRLLGEVWRGKGFPSKG